MRDTRKLTIILYVTLAEHSSSAKFSTNRPPQGSSRRSLLNPKSASEGQIRSLDEPEAKTLIGRREKRKQRYTKELFLTILFLVVEFNYYYCYFDRIFKEETPEKTPSDLQYTSKIDKVSETEIVEAVQIINYSIDNLIANILASVKECKLSYYKVSPPKTRKHHNIPSNPDLDVPVLHILLMDSPSLLSDDTRDFVVELILHNLVSLLIHKHYFKGGHFFGVGSESLREHLETMFSKLVEGGKYIYIYIIMFPLIILILTNFIYSENSDPTAIQRWRSMSVEAVFQMNDGVDSLLYGELSSHLKRTLKDAYPLSLSPQPKKVKPGSESIYESIVHGEKNSLLDLIRQARNLSFMIQQVVSCQILVTIALSAQTSPDDEDTIGTYSFGLQKNLQVDPDRRTTSILMKPKFITSAVLRSHLLLED